MSYIQKRAFFFNKKKKKKKGANNFTTPCLIPFLSVLHQNKWSRLGLAYCHQTFQSGDLLKEAATLKVTLPFSHLVF